MFTINYDPTVRVLYVAMQGFFEPDETREYRLALEKALKDAGPGVNLLVDKRELFTLPPESLEELALIRDFRRRTRTINRCALVFAGKVAETQFKRTYSEEDKAENESFFTDLDEARRFVLNQDDVI